MPQSRGGTLLADSKTSQIKNKIVQKAKNFCLVLKGHWLSGKVFPLNNRPYTLHPKANKSHDHKPWQAEASTY